MRILPWVALGCAFAPVLIQLVDAIPKIPYGWSLLLAPALIFAAASRSEQRAQPRRGRAMVLLIAGLLIELAGLAGGSPGIARLGLPISVVGLSVWTGAPRAMTALLVFWAIPIPGTLYGLTTPNLESAYAQSAAAVIGALGAEISASGPLVRSGVERLVLDPHHSGIHLIFLVTQLSWYAAVRRALPLTIAIARTALAALLAAPLQLFAVWIAVLLLAAGAPDAANFWLDHGAWVFTAILGIVWIETGLTRANRPQAP